MSLITPDYTNQLRYLSYYPPWGTGPSYTRNGPYFISGNVGIGTTGPAGPLSFFNSDSEKIVLGGTTGNNYGFGISNNQLLIHSDTNTSDITFGYGTGSNFNELMRVKSNYGTGPLVGVGKSNPSITLDVVGTSRASNLLTTLGNDNGAGAVGYYSLGIITNNAAVGTGERFKISIIGDYGGGISNTYGGECTIYGSFLNNSAQTSANINGTWYIQNCLNTMISDVKFVQVGTNRNSYYLYVNIVGQYTLQGPYVTSTTNITFIPEFRYIGSDPGANSATVQIAQGRFTLQNSNVGLGTVSPGNPLTVNGTMSVGTNATNNLVFTPGSYWNGSSVTTDASSLGIDMGGTQRMVFKTNFILNDGKMGIGLGTLTPNFWLSFPDTLGDKIVLWGTSTTDNYGFGIQGSKLQIHSAVNANIVFGYGSSTSLTETMRLETTSGTLSATSFYPNVSVGFAFYCVISASFAAYNSGGGLDTFWWPRWTDNAMYTNYGSGGWQIRNNNSTSFMYINNAGNIGVGPSFFSPNSDSTIHFNGTDSAMVYYNSQNGGGAYYRNGLDSNANYWVLYNQNGRGVYLGNGFTYWTNVSDERIKKNINPMSDSLSLEKISLLRPVSYNIFTESDNAKKHYGLIAQELQEVIPEVISIASYPGVEGDVLGVSYTGLIPFLIGAIKELKKQNDVIRQNILNTKDSINTIKSKLGL